MVCIADKLVTNAIERPQLSSSQIEMSEEAAATWTNGDGGGKESEGVLDSYCQPPDPETSTEPSRKRMRSSSSDSNQSSAECSVSSQSQKKMKIVVRTIRSFLLLMFCS